MSDFWDEFSTAFANETGMDRMLQGKELKQASAPTEMQMLTEKQRRANALPLPVEAGTRVRFVANVGSVLTYDNIPGKGVEGTVVKVKSADGNLTAQDERVFVQWDDGTFRPIYAEHLRLATSNKRMARNLVLRASSLGDISSMFSMARSGGGDELVHRATKDLWSFRKDTGGFVIERLFDTNGKPLKV